MPIESDDTHSCRFLAHLFPVDDSLVAKCKSGTYAVDALFRKKKLKEENLVCSQFENPFDLQLNVTMLNSQKIQLDHAHDQKPDNLFN